MVQERAAEGTVPRLTRKHVVVAVDDEVQILATLRRLLRREPYELVTTDSPEEALKWVQERDVSLLIVDERMPGMKGMDLIQAVREKSPRTTRVMLTAYPNSGMILERVKQGFHRLITKPWNDADLKRTIRELLYDRELEEGRPSGEDRQPR